MEAGNAMSVNQKRANRKPSGGRYKKLVKVLANLGRLPSNTKVGDVKKRILRGRGGIIKNTLLGCDKVNVYDAKNKKTKIAKIKTIVESPSNRHFVRRNILTKGAVVETDMGRVKITSRPGQEGSLNGVLVG